MSFLIDPSVTSVRRLKASKAEQIKGTELARQQLHDIAEYS